MENFIVLLLLFAMSDPTFKERLTAFLAFYKENRELLAALTENKAPMSATPPEKSEKESRPKSEVGDLTVLEEYLRRLSEKS